MVLLGAFGLALAGPLAAAAQQGSVKPPDDPLFKYQWNLRELQLPAAWAFSRGAGVTVAVLDTGVAYEDRGRYRRAPDLAGTRFAAGRDFVGGDAHPADVPPAGGGRSHGTQIAGIIAQTAGNGIGAAGVAPRATIMPIRVLEPDLSGSAQAIADGLRFAADHGADVANLSIAGRSRSRALERAVDYASAKGVTIVAAAGNEGRAAVSWPAAYPKVIAVGAVARDRRRAYYSNYGRALDLVAPGGAGERVDAGYGPGDGVVAQTLKGGPAKFCFCFMASTSAAAAEVSGVAALLLGAGRAGNPAEVRAALSSSARDLGPPGRDREYGAGLVQAFAALGGTEAARASARPQPPGAPRPAPNGSWPGWLAPALAAVLLVALGGLALRRRSS